MMRMAILFDFGGTLDADGVSWLDRFYPLYGEAGVETTREAFARAFYDSDDHLARRFPLRGLSLEATVALQVRCVLEAMAPDKLAAQPAIAARFLADSRRHLQRNRPVLEALRRDHRLGVVSNFYGNLESVLRSEGLRELFDVVADSGAVGFEKPDPRLFRHALDALGAAPSRCLMVGDSVPRDMRGAESLGLAHALIAPPGAAPCCSRGSIVRALPELEARRGLRHAGIIAAGEGSRLREVAPGLPKPLVPVSGRPLCHWVAESLRRAGATELTILLNSRGSRVRESLAAAFPDLRWTFLQADTASSWESFRLVSGRLAQVCDRYLISTVDAIIPGTQVAHFASAMALSGARAGLALTHFIDDEKPLWAEMDPSGIVTSLGTSPGASPGLATAGLYYITRELALGMPKAGDHDSLRSYLSSMTRAVPVSGWPLGRAIDVDRPEDLPRAEEALCAWRGVAA